MKYISLLLFILLLCGCKQQELLNHLDQQQANDVLAVLQRHNINAEKKDQGKTGFSIFVEPTDFASAVDWLKIYNLPGKPDIQISQMFPADALVSSPRAEKARLYSAIEQRLEQSLKIMDGIISSRVHVSYDVDNGDSGKTALPIHISVLAVYEKDIKPEIKINDIKRFIVNSFASVQYENISVVLSKRRDIIEQAPTYEISEPVFAYDKAMPVSILLALISVATCWLLWKYRAILTNLVRLKIK
ncbi:EscJ/YscJ/HrcJ family type III secretion inner membrane ring protein [Escherichia coli]|nr:EscJ/YscJ/HrcJ family type III secretion inner membrane ring protein [Escherichia coli]